jgi:hypothetical protein
MRKIALLALALTCVSAPAFAQTTQQTAPSLTGGVPNPITGVPNPITGVPNPISPLGVDPRTQQIIPTRPFGEAAPTQQDLTRDSRATELHLTPFGAATVQNPIGVPHPMGQVVPNANSEAGD